MVGNNSDSLMAYMEKNKAGKVYQAAPEDAYALITLQDGRTYKQEFYYGSTYLSQTSRSVKFSDAMKAVDIYDFLGKKKYSINRYESKNYK